MRVTCSVDCCLLMQALLLCLVATPVLAQNTQGRPEPPPRTTVAGYMDLHFNKPEFEDGKVDFHRFVLLFAHSFTDRIRFVGELELEHALVEWL